MAQPFFVFWGADRAALTCCLTPGLTALSRRGSVATEQARVTPTHMAEPVPNALDENVSTNPSQAPWYASWLCALTPQLVAAALQQRRWQRSAGTFLVQVVC